MTLSVPILSEKSSWQTLLTLDRKSDDFTHSARQLLSDQRSGKAEASRFPEEEALNIIELIEQTILHHPDITGKLKSTAFTVLRRLCGAFGKLPGSCLINEDFKTKEEIPFATRGHTDLWKRDWNGRKVAVKALRFGPDDDRSRPTKKFCKEALLWKFLNHPNILPFYGASMSPNQFCMVFPWMENGNVLSYTKKNPEANRLRLLIDVASGLKFLHRMSLVHGDIRGSNILISDTQPPRALLADFGLNAISSDYFSLTRESINWTAPELLALDSTTYLPTISSDIYALAMAIYEVLTGTPPFARKEKTELACGVVLEGERPQRPKGSEKLGFTDKVWEVLQRCWEKTPSARPPVDDVSTCLKQAAEIWVVDVPAFMLASEAGVEQVMNMKEDQAKDFANQLDKTLDEIGIRQHSGKTYLKYLQKLCGASGVLPASFMLAEGFDNIEPRPFASGGFADVYRATYKGRLVVAKALKTTSMDDLDNVHKRFAKEVVGWKWLRHENILPFVGVTSEPPPFSMVSAWMENGNIMGFIRANQDQSPFNLMGILVDVSNGLQYLHQHDFVHGDLKGANILINSDRRACLADFGLAAIIEETASIDGASNNKIGGTIRWMAPEILNPEKYGYVKRARRKLPSKSTDIYALGMTILEVITGRRPFEHTNPDAAVIQKVLSGIRPARPSVGFSDALWMILVKTWVEEFEASDSPSARPNIADIVELLQKEAENRSPTSRPMALPSAIERRPSGTSSNDSYEFPDRLVGRTGEEPMDVSSRSRIIDIEYLLEFADNAINPKPTGGSSDVREADSDDSEDIAPRGNFDEILTEIGRLAGPAAADNDWGILDVESLAPSPSSHPIPPPPDVTREADWFSQIANEILDLTDQVASVALFGSIGVGKSFVARFVLDHDRTKAKFSDNRYSMHCDDLVNSQEGFLGRLSDTINANPTQIQSRLQSSPPLILLLDGVDSALDPLTPEAEEIYARIKEFGSYEHVCLVTTSRRYPDIHGFHRVEIPTPPEDGARDIFYGLCNLDRSPAVDTLLMELDYHPFSIELLARSTRENNWDEYMLLEAWDDQKGVLRTSYYQGLKDIIEPVFHSPRIKGLGTMARDVLEAIASLQPGIGEHQLEGRFHRTGRVKEVVDVLCGFSLVHRRDGVLKMLSPLQFYFLKSMLVYAETEEVVRWGPDCAPAPGLLPVFTRGPPDDWLSSPTSSSSIGQNTDCASLRLCSPQPVPTPGPSGSRPSQTTPRLEAPRRRKWMKGLSQIVMKGLLPLFGCWISPAILIDDIQEDSANIPPTDLRENPTDTPPTTAHEVPANTPPTTAQADPASTSPTATQEDPMDASPAAAQEDLTNIPPTDPHQRSPPAPVAYEID